MKVKVKKLNPSAIMPTRGSVCAAGYDLYACLGDQVESVSIAPHTSTKIPTGIAIECVTSEPVFGGIFARSGLASKEGLRPANCVGVVDSDYRGEVCVVLQNDSNFERRVTNGERIAQMVFMPYIPAEFEEASELSDTVRGEGGFGSTGK